jgi:hypothetical protein
MDTNSKVRVCMAGLAAMLLYTPSFSSNVYTKSTELRPVRLSDTELQTEIDKLSNLIKSANAAVSIERYTERVTFESGKTKVEIPGHRFVSSEVGIPKASYGFEYYYYARTDEAPIMSVSLGFGDYLRTISVNGNSPEQVDAIFSTIESDFLEYSTPIGGSLFRDLCVIALSYIFLGGTIVGFLFWLRNKNIRNLGVALFSIVGIVLIITLPFKDILAGFAVYRGEASLIVRYGYQISFAALLISLVGIVLSATNVFRRTEKQGTKRVR